MLIFGVVILWPFAFSIDSVAAAASTKLNNLSFKRLNSSFFESSVIETQTRFFYPQMRRRTRGGKGLVLQTFQYSSRILNRN